MSLFSESHSSSHSKYAIIIQVLHNSLKDYDADEMDGLVRTAGYKVCVHITQHVNHVNATFLVGKGKANGIKEYLDLFFNKKGRHIKSIKSNSSLNYDMIYPDLTPEELASVKSLENAEPPFTNEEEDTADLVNEIIPNNDDFVDLKLAEDIEDNRDLTIIFNNRLGNMQILNLEKFWKVRVLDRDAIVLEIFEKNARSRESILEVELAKIGLQTSRIKKEFGRMKQEHQGVAFGMGAGKGMAGWVPVQRAFTTRRKKITDELEEIRNNRNLRRKTRSKFFNIGIMGYTNAGKTTLLNSLAKQKLETNNQEFTTVSTASRKVVFPWYDEFGVFHREEMIFTDSVGFVYDISPQFIHAFLSTLEELQFSDLLTIVVDIADPKFERLKTKIETTFQVIEQIGASNIPRVIVFNKSDLLDPQELIDRVNITKTYFPDTPTTIISAKNKLGYEELIRIFLEFKSKLRPDLNSKKKDS